MAAPYSLFCLGNRQVATPLGATGLTATLANTQVSLSWAAATGDGTLSSQCQELVNGRSITLSAVATSATYTIISVAAGDAGSDSPSANVVITLARELDACLRE